MANGTVKKKNDNDSNQLMEVVKIDELFCAFFCKQIRQPSLSMNQLHNTNKQILSYNFLGVIFDNTSLLH